jgi:hypothetical protein
MIVFGRGGKAKDLGLAEHRVCPTCEKERPFNLVIQYRYAHLFWLRWVTHKQYLLACSVCHRGERVDSKEVEAKLDRHPIPFMTRYGWTFLAAFFLIFVCMAVL